MSDTSETDARDWSTAYSDTPQTKLAVKTNLEFTRDLERQRNEAREENARLREALARIKAIENRCNGGDWDEIEEAREIAQQALTP